MQREVIYIGDIGAEAYGYVHLVGQCATIEREHPILPLVCISVKGEEIDRWIHREDAIRIGDTCPVTKLSPVACGYVVDNLLVSGPTLGKIWAAQNQEMSSPK